MDASAQKICDILFEDFSSASGPVGYNWETIGWFYEFEGNRIEKALLNLDPKDLLVEDLEFENSQILGHATNEGIKWVIPGIIRAFFEDEELEDPFDYYLFDELLKRVLENGLTFTESQKRSMLEAHEIYYCQEKYGWDVSKYSGPFILWLKGNTRENNIDQQVATFNPNSHQTGS